MSNETSDSGSDSVISDIHAGRTHGGSSSTSTSSSSTGSSSSECNTTASSSTVSIPPSHQNSTATSTSMVVMSTRRLLTAAELVRQRVVSVHNTPSWNRNLSDGTEDGSLTVLPNKNNSDINRSDTATTTTKAVIDLDEEIRRLEQELEASDDDSDHSTNTSDFSDGQDNTKPKPSILSLSKSNDAKIESLPAQQLPAIRNKQRNLNGVEKSSVGTKKRRRTDPASEEQTAVSNGLRLAVQEVLRGYQPRSAERLPFYCRVCATQFDNAESFFGHQSGTFHKTAVTLERKASFCKLCRKQLTSPAQLKEHVKSKPHKQRLYTMQSRRTHGKSQEVERASFGS